MKSKNKTTAKNPLIRTTLLLTSLLLEGVALTYIALMFFGPGGPIAVIGGLFVVGYIFLVVATIKDILGKLGSDYETAINVLHFIFGLGSGLFLLGFYNAFQQLSF